MSSAGVGPLCFLKTKNQLFKDADFIFQQDLAPAHTAKSTKSWLNDHGVGVLDWPANSPDLNPRENIWDIVKRKMRNKRPKNTDELKATVKETVSGYVCNHGSPNGERDTASPRGRYGERLSVTRVWRYIFKNTTCWPATAHDVTTGVPQYKCRREDTSSASSSEACVRSMVQSLGDAVSRSPFGETWLHT